MKKGLGIIVLYFFLFFTFTSDVSAVSTPAFSSCVSPQGTLKVSYASGTHGIAGSTGTHTGSDSVYTQEGGNLVQCFCPESGSNGIQTNWLKASGYSQDDIQVLKNDGWIYIANGSLWGLDPVAYLAKNHDYACRGSSNGTSGSSNGASTNTSSPTQAILAAATTTLSLAGTGNMTAIVFSFLLADMFLFIFFLLRRLSR